MFTYAKAVRTEQKGITSRGNSSKVKGLKAGAGERPRCGDVKCDAAWTPKADAGRLEFYYARLVISKSFYRSRGRGVSLLFCHVTKSPVEEAFLGPDKIPQYSISAG